MVFLGKGTIYFVITSTAVQNYALIYFRWGFHLTGTIRENRIGFPKNLGNPLPVKAERGTSRWFREGQTVFVKWKDTKVVCVISSFYPATGILLRGLEEPLLMVAM